MDLSIAYVCPQCEQSFSERLIDLFPGKPHLCPDCGSSLRLTSKSLRRLETDLRNFCNQCPAEPDPPPSGQPG